MERTDHGYARDQGRDAAAARIVRAAALRLALALTIASFTAALSLAALSARTEELVVAPALPPAPAQPAGGGADRSHTDRAAPALRTDI
jgi:hypothetical protein